MHTIDDNGCLVSSTFLGMAHMTRQPHLCITSPWNYPLFQPDCQTHFGGWEVRIAVIARELARRGRLKVSLVVGDHGQDPIEQIDGITFHSWTGRQIWGIPVREKPPEETSASESQERSHLHERLMRLIRRRSAGPVGTEPLQGKVGPYVITPEMISIYDRVNADIYMVPGNSQFSAEVAFFCAERGRKFVFLSGSDFDYFPEYKLHPEQSDMYGVPHVLKLYSIEKAAAHIVQNQRQAAMLRDVYQRSADVIPNPIDTKPRFPRNPQPRTILWVGKSDERIKRPSLVLDLARALPQYQFVVIMNPAVQATHEMCVKQIRGLPNVTLVERVPFSRIESYFADARLHINTSVFEGFPNTFLQAAKYGVPTISLQVDPGSMLSQYGSGLVCGGNLQQFREAVSRLMEASAEYEALSRQAVQYVKQNHDKDVLVERYEKILLALV
jgi:glycosyltransferase involved in cell wall biosynthesis